MSDSWNKNLYTKYPIYKNKESLPLLIYNGKVIINDYQNYPVSGRIFYLDESNQIKYIPNLIDILFVMIIKIFTIYMRS